MAARFPAYDGSGSYAFVSYSHKDSDTVYPIISTLHEMGYNIWYDEGIPLIVNYGGELYRRIKGCSIFILFVSGRSVVSRDVNKEVENAFGLNKEVVRINIDDSPLPDSWAYHLPPTSQYISVSAEPSEFYSKLSKAVAGCRDSAPAHGTAFSTPVPVPVKDTAAVQDSSDDDADLILKVKQRVESEYVAKQPKSGTAPQQKSVSMASREAYKRRIVEQNKKRIREQEELHDPEERMILENAQQKKRTLIISSLILAALCIFFAILFSTMSCEDLRSDPQDYSWADNITIV